HAHVREEVERLEDDSDPAPNPVHVDAAPGDLLSREHDSTRIQRLQQVDAAQQRRLPRARGADQAGHLVLADAEIDPVEAKVIPEPLAQPLDLERRRIGHASSPSAWRRRRSRAISQSVKRASGIVIATKSTVAARYGVKLNVASTSICDRLNGSSAPSRPTSDVSFCSPMRPASKRGSTRRTDA